jgi:thioredoxin 1
MATVNLCLNDLEQALENNSIVMMDFWAEWCGPCKMFGPIFEKVSEKHPDIKFAKINTEEEQDLAAAFGISSIPTLAIFRDKILIFKQPGLLQEKVLEDLISQVRTLDMDDVRKKIAEHDAEHPHDHEHDHDHDHNHGHSHAN